MGKPLNEYREENDAALKFFDEYVTPLRTEEWKVSAYVPIPPPKAVKHGRPMTGLNMPLAPHLPKKKSPSPNSDRQRLKKKLFEKQFGMCAYCDDPLKFEEATLDHRKARSKGGTLRSTNAVVVCYDCNQMKGDISSIAEANERIFVFSEFIARLAKKGYLT